jgi:uroporphyrinogen decarboxylase
MLGKQLECARMVGEGLDDADSPILQTIFSPLSQARMIAGRGLYLRHMRTNPDRLHTGLNIITESTLRFLEALKRLPLAGIFYVMGQASYDDMSEEEYRIFGLPYDAKILEALPEKWWFNMAHLHGEAPMFRLCGQLPVKAINWHDQETEPDLGQGKLLFNGAVCGGLSREAHIHLGTPATIRDKAREAINQTNGRRLIVSTGSAILVTSPLSNIRAVREVVETQGV